MASPPAASHSSARALLPRFLRTDYKYASINDSEQPRWRLGRWTTITAIIVLIAFSVATFGVLSMRSKSSLGFQPVSCGKTIKEAREHGCTFDALTLTWLRPECSLHGQTEFIESAGAEPWSYWQEKEGALVELGGYETLADLAPGTRYLATYEQFLDHCMWILLRVHHALEYGERLDFKTISYEHSKDCLSLLLKDAKAGVGENLTRLTTRAEAPDIGFGVC